MKLPWVFFYGLLFSTLLLAACFELFAYLAAGRWIFWEAGLSNDDYFEVSRNAVTLAAALGLGVTLFFSFRKQQSTEVTHMLETQKHELDQIRGLRDRYSRSAEQIASDKPAIRLAGVHSLAALSDDWAAMGNDDEQQVCVSLLCSYIGLSSSAEEGSVDVGISTAVEVTLSRLTLNTEHPEKFWGKRKISIERAVMRSLPNNITINGGNLDIFECSLPMGSSFGELRLSSGNLSFTRGSGELSVPGCTNSQFIGGMAMFHGSRRSGSEYIPFSKCTFDGTNVIIFPDCDGMSKTEFTECTFSGGKLTLIAYTGRAKVVFKNCTFSSSKVVSVNPLRHDSADVEFINCMFIGDAATMRQDPQGAVLMAPVKPEPTTDTNQTGKH